MKLRPIGVRGWPATWYHVSTLRCLLAVEQGCSGSWLVGGQRSLSTVGVVTRRGQLAVAHVNFSVGRICSVFHW